MSPSISLLTCLKIKSWSHESSQNARATRSLGKKNHLFLMVLSLRFQVSRLSDFLPPRTPWCNFCFLCWRKPMHQVKLSRCIASPSLPHIRHRGWCLPEVPRVAVTSKRTAWWERNLQKWHGEGESPAWCDVQLLLETGHLRPSCCYPPPCP